MNTCIRLVIFCAATLSFLSCRRDATPEEPTLCTRTAVVYGYKGPRADTTGEQLGCTLGSVEMASGAMPGTATFDNRTYYNQGAYHRGENCYYTFKREDTAHTLYKINESSVTPLAYSGPAGYLDGLVYDRLHNKLFCFRTSAGTSRIAEITVSGSSYTATPVSYFTEVEAHDNTTIDPGTGDIYFQTYNAAAQTYSVRKFEPGSSSTPSVIYSAHTWELYGLRYNTNDNMLYALRLSPVTDTSFEFVKISPAGVLAVVADLGINMNAKYVSACLNPCDQQYVFAAQVLPNVDSFRMYYLNMAGTIVHTQQIPQAYQGLDVRY